MLLPRAVASSTTIATSSWLDSAQPGIAIFNARKAWAVDIGVANVFLLPTYCSAICRDVSFGTIVISIHPPAGMVPRCGRADDYK